MRSIHLSVLGVACVLNSCVTTHSGTVVNDHKKDMALSCARDRDLDSERFFLVACTVENTTDQWKNFSFKSFEFSNQPAKVKLSKPDEILAFHEAYRFQQEKDQFNGNMVLSGLVIVGAVAALGHSSSSVATAGAVTSMGAVAVMTGKQISRDHHDAQYGNIFGPTHLLGEQFKVPPKMFVRKHILVEANSVQDLSNEVNICLTSPSTECIKVPFHRIGPYATRD